MSDLEWNNVRDVSCLADAAGRGIKWHARDFGPRKSHSSYSEVSVAMGRPSSKWRYSHCAYLAFSSNDFDDGAHSGFAEADRGRSGFNWELIRFSLDMT